MNYCTMENLINRFGRDEILQLSDREGNQVINESVVNDLIVRSSTMIDDYLRARYDLPLKSIPATLQTACENLTYDLLHKNSTETSEKYRKDAVKSLEQISMGKVVLDVAAAPDGASTGKARSLGNQSRTFNQTELDDYNDGGGYGNRGY